MRQPRTRAQRFLGVALAGLFVFVGVQRASAQTPATGPDPIRTGQDYYDNSRFDDAIRLLAPLVRSKSLSSLDLQLASEILARSYVRAGNSDEAISTFVAMLERDPTWRPDKLVVPPRELSVFEEALRAFETEKAPFPPSGLKTRAKSQSSIQLTWHDDATNETGFQIERRSLAEPSFVLLTTTPPNTSSYVDMGLAPGTAYIYRIRAVNRRGPSAYSDEVALTAPLTFQAGPKWGAFVGGHIGTLQGKAIDDREAFADSVEASFPGSRMNQSSNLKGTVGVSLEYPLKQRLSLQTELALAKSGTTIDSYVGNVKYLHEEFSFTTLELPVLAKIRLGSRPWFPRPYAGFSASFLLSSNYESVDATGSVIASGSIDGESSVDFGIDLGVESRLFDLKRYGVLANIGYRAPLSARIDATASSAEFLERSVSFTIGLIRN